MSILSTSIHPFNPAGTESFASRLIAARARLGLTQQELAKRAEVVLLLLRKLEQAELEPEPEVQARLANVLADEQLLTDAPRHFPRVVPRNSARFATDYDGATTLIQHEPASAKSFAGNVAPDFLAEHTLAGPAQNAEVHLLGTTRRGYRFDEEIGRGGFGSVFRARQLSVGRDVAIKVINPELADDPEFICRFEAEAELVDQLEHPCIVPLYDFWREPGAAFMVMRLLKGGSLAQALQKATPLANPLAILRQVAMALSTAHKACVVHRDLKPANVLLDELGNCCLADFGVAKKLDNDSGRTQIGEIVGSIAYCSPEQLRGTVVNASSDIYALGLLAFELFTGRRPFSGSTREAIIYQHLNQPPPSVREFSPQLSERVDAVLKKALAKSPEDRFSDATSFVIELEAEMRGAKSGWMGTHDDAGNSGLTTSISAELSEQDNPFVGLSAFDESNARQFFGREAMIECLLDRLRESVEARAQGLSRALFVVGASGSGKSSVVRAGLIPALRAGQIKGADRWLISTFMPGAQPLQALQAALLRVASIAPDGLDALMQERTGFSRAIDRSLAPGTELLLVIDQFEELFTLCTDTSERELFIAQLCNALLEPYSRLRAVFTLRADFLDRPLQHVDLAELLRARTEMIPAMTMEELERAIVGPAKRAGLVFEPGLVAAILADMGGQASALPMLQYSLAELFRRRAGFELTLSAFRQMGGIRGALANRAQSTFEALDAPAQLATQQLFLRLTTLGEGREDTRRRAFLHELNALFTDPTPLQKAINAYSDARLLSHDRDQASALIANEFQGERLATVEVAHEALLRSWPLLQDWLAGSRADLRLQRQLAEATKQWQEAPAEGKDAAGFLASSARLAQYLPVRERGLVRLTEPETQFLDASFAHEQAAAEMARERNERELMQAQALAEQERKIARAALERADADSRSKRRLRWIAALLSLILAVAVWQTARLNERGKALQVQTDRANVEARSANALSEFWRSLFATADPNQAKGRDPTVKEVLELGIDKAALLSETPAVQAKLLLQMSQSLRSLGKLERSLAALDQAQKALGILQQDRTQAELVSELGLERGRILADLARPEEALAVLERVRAMQAENRAAPLARAVTMNIIASIYNDQNRYAEAAPLLEQTLALRQNGASEVDIVTAHNNLGFALLQMGRAKDARLHFLAVLEKRQKLLGPLHTELAIAQMNLGNVERDLGQFSAARTHYDAAEVILRKLLDATQPHPLFASLATNRAACAMLERDLPRAERLYQSAWAAQKAMFGVDSPQQSGALLGLGRLALLNAHSDTELAAARTTLAQALAFAQTRVGERHPSLAAAAARLAEVNLRLNDRAESQRWLEFGESVIATADARDLRLRTERAALRMLAADLASDAAQKRALLAQAQTLLEPAKDLARARELLTELQQRLRQTAPR